MKHVWVFDTSDEGASPLVDSLPDVLYEKTTWTDVDSLSDSLVREPPDLIVIEYSALPGEPAEALRALRSRASTVPFIVVARETSTRGAIESMREGAYDYLPRGTLPRGLEDAARRALSGEGGVIQTIGSPGPADVAQLGAIVGRTPEMLEIHKLIGQVAATKATVLVQGEPGTGKELVARAIHYNSARRAGQFVAVNCGAMGDEALVKELFGGTRTESRSRLEQADGGTVFLADIDRAGAATQAGLVTVLEDGHFERPGSRRRIRVDARVIAATGRSLVRSMKDGIFRVDLFYRLKVVSLFMPPLRERGDDILFLAEHFLERAKSSMRKEVRGISVAAGDLLRSYPWPGNLREMEQAVMRAVALNKTGVLGPEDFELAAAGPEGEEAGLRGSLVSAVRGEFLRLVGKGAGGIDRAVVAQVEDVLVREALDAVGGSQVKAARLLGISRNTLRKRLTTSGERGGGSESEEGR